VSLSRASGIVDPALNAIRELELRTLTVIVLDPRGHPAPIDCARESMEMPGHWRGRRSRHTTRDPAFVAAISECVVSSRGGVLICDTPGKLLGTIGVGGDRPENDESLCVADVESAARRCGSPRPLTRSACTHGEDGRKPFRNHQARLRSAGDLSRRRIHDPARHEHGHCRPPSMQRASGGAQDSIR
jgi:uncharacterized protein GlcG (DUF336 family)